MSASTARQMLLEVIVKRRSGELTVKEFCDRFERAFNFQIAKDQLDPEERAAFQRLFDEVVLYSPFPEDRKEYPGYRDEQAIDAAVTRVWKKIQ